MIQNHNMYIILHHETSFECHSKKLDSHSQKTCKTKKLPGARKPESSYDRYVIILDKRIISYLLLSEV